MSESTTYATVAEIESCMKSGLKSHTLITITDLTDGCGGKYDLLLVSTDFAGMKLLDRHRLVNGLLTTSGLMQKIHAVTIKAKTPEEYETMKAKEATA